jgi:hypothetical protein
MVWLASCKGTFCSFELEVTGIGVQAVQSRHQYKSNEKSKTVNLLGRIKQLSNYYFQNHEDLPDYCCVGVLLGQCFIYGNSDIHFSSGSSIGSFYALYNMSSAI